MTQFRLLWGDSPKIDLFTLFVTHKRFSNSLLNISLVQPRTQGITLTPYPGIRIAMAPVIRPLGNRLFWRSNADLSYLWGWYLSHYDIFQDPSHHLIIVALFLHKTRHSSNPEVGLQINFSSKSKVHFQNFSSDYITLSMIKERHQMIKHPKLSSLCDFNRQVSAALGEI